MSEEIKFEKALERLEKIVADLEAGNASLEEALKKYEEGVKLSVLCQKRLSEAEKKIEVLTRTLDGAFKKEPFDFEENGEEKPAGRPATDSLAGRPKKSIKPEAGEGEGTLL